MRLSTPTLYLLKTSILVGCSGGLRLYLAYILADVSPNISLIIAASLIIYATYTLDRSLGQKEDEVNRRELSGANKTAGLVASGFAIIIGALFFFHEYLFFPPLFPFVMGFLYSQGISLNGRKIKLKGGAGGKNLVIGITWGGTIGLIIASTGRIAAAVVIALFFVVKLFINSTIFDFKDTEGDLMAGIKTLPLCLGIKKTKCLLLSLCTLQHAILFLAVLTGILVHSCVFLIYSFCVSCMVITWYAPTFESDSSWFLRKFRTLMIDGEAIALSGLSIILPY
jgi:4-hydroxybenzoate polyprenyltransferase